MLDIFKNWISMILGIGILFTVIRLILPNTKLKKYIYSLMGIVTIIVFLNPVISFFNSNNLEESIEDVMLDMTGDESLKKKYTDISNYELIGQSNVKDNFKENVQNDIKAKLEKEIDDSIKVSIDVSDDYNISKVYINLTKETSFDITSFINQEYDIDKNKIDISIGG